MKTEKLFIAASGAALLLWGCNVKDTIYETVHPGHGKITLTTDWTNRTEGITVPASYTAKIGDYSTTLQGETNTIDHLFGPGNYRLHVHNTAENITLGGIVAAVREVSGNADGAGKFIDNAPGWFFSCVIDVAVEKDREYVLTGPMNQQVRQLTLVITPSGGSVERIERIEGYLSGAAGTLDIDSDTHSTPANVELSFAKGTDGKYRATVRLLGVAGGEQKLVATLFFAGGSPAAVSLDSDLTAVLADFNRDKKTPLTLDGEIIETPTETGFTATIDTWMPIPDSSGTAW